MKQNNNLIIDTSLKCNTPLNPDTEIRGYFNEENNRLYNICWGVAPTNIIQPFLFGKIKNIRKNLSCIFSGEI